MLNPRLVSMLVGFTLTLAAPGIAMPEAAMKPMHGTDSTQGFERVEQPLAVRFGVTAVGVGLIGLELWWFLWSKPRSHSEERS